MLGLVMAALAVGLATAAEPVDYADFNELDLEALLDQTVTTASRHTQKLADAPAAVTVITGEEIAASGARSLPEVLRSVPGLDIMMVTSSADDVSARGLNRPGSNAMLVLVDGRSVYVDFYGLTAWKQITVALDDIKAIEVILGPGSAMYGANAFAGVINIITYPPAERPGNTARITASDLGESYGSFRHAAVHDDLSWRMSGSWDRTTEWEQDISGAENARLDASVRLDLAPATWLSVGAGYTNGTVDVVAADEPVRSDGHNDYLRFDATHGELTVRGYTNSYQGSIEAGVVTFGAGPAILDSRLIDLEFQHAWRPGRTHYLMWGGSYRHQRTRFSLQPGEPSDRILAGFVLEEWTPLSALSLSLGLRAEDHSLVGSELSPRGSLVVRPADGHHLRASYSEAFRAPTYLETRWVTSVELMPGLEQLVRGDLDNESERIESFELGYQGLLTPQLLIGATLFRQHLSELISLQPVAFHPSPPAPVSDIPSEVAFLNGASWKATGGELSVQADPTPWLRLSGFYAHVAMEDADSGETIEQVPRLAGLLAARIALAADHQVQVRGRHRSGTTWQYDSAGYYHDEHVAGSILLDLSWRIGSPFADRHVTIGVDNVLDRRHRDHPLAIEQRRRFYSSVAVTF